MYKRLSAILFPLVTIVLIGSMFWGYQENREKNSILIKAENQYQRAFHDLSFHMDHLHTELGNALAVNSKSQGFHRKCLINAWRLTSQAQNEINQLPLTLLPFNKTEEFLSKIANFSYQTAVRDLDKEPLSTQEMETLKSLYERSDDISKELNAVQDEVLSKNLRWMDVEVAMARENRPADNSIINGFDTVDKKVSAYDEINFGPSVLSIYDKRNYKSLSGSNFSEEQIRKKAAEFLGIQDLNSIKVVENGAETDFDSYSVIVAQPENESSLSMDYTKKAGELIWYMDNRSVEETNMSVNDAIEKANVFLQKHKYDGMKAVNFDEFNNVVSITFARTMDDVIIYPEKLSVKVALDNGEITGMEAADYIFEHKERQVNKPKLSMAEARNKLNPNYKVKDTSLALIKNELNNEVICYQFLGNINGSNYRIYINGDTGLEEKIEQINS